MTTRGTPASYRLPNFAQLHRRLQAARRLRPVGQPGTLRLEVHGLQPDAARRGQWRRPDNLNLGDNNIKPESEQETELGFDATMFQSRAQFSATVYQKRLTSLLLQAGCGAVLRVRDRIHQRR